MSGLVHALHRQGGDADLTDRLGADAVAGLLRLRRDCGPDGPSGRTGLDTDPRRPLGAPAPAEFGTPAPESRFDATQLRDVRHAVDEALRGQGFPDGRAEEVTVAVDEVATDVVRHGTRTARLMPWTPEQDVVREVRVRAAG